MIINHLSAGVVTFYKDTNTNELFFLLLRYPQGHIEFPKGHVDETDTDLIHTALRELEEETGLTGAKIIDGFYEEVNYQYFHNGDKHIKKVCFYLAEVFEKKVEISHEHTEFFWESYDSALNKVSFDNSRSLLMAAKTLIDMKNA